MDTKYTLYQLFRYPESSKGPPGPSKPVGPDGPRLDSYGGQGFVSGTKNHTIGFVLYDYERTGLRPARSAKRDATTKYPTKNGGNFWILSDPA